MVEARVRFFGPIRSLVGKREQVVILEDGATLRQLLEELGHSNPPEFQRHLVVQGGMVNSSLLLAVNGQGLDDSQTLDSPLPATTTVDVMLAIPIMGG